MNTTNIKVIVKQMFEMFKKNVEDAQLSKEEFIKWYELCLIYFIDIFSFSFCFSCTEKYIEIGCAFLPDIPGKKVLILF